jgi:hypothetical protein
LSVLRCHPWRRSSDADGMPGVVIRDFLDVLNSS